MNVVFCVGFHSSVTHLGRWGLGSNDVLQFRSYSLNDVQYFLCWSHFAAVSIRIILFLTKLIGMSHHLTNHQPTRPSPISAHTFYTPIGMVVAVLSIRQLQRHELIDSDIAHQSPNIFMRFGSYDNNKIYKALHCSQIHLCYVWVQLYRPLDIRHNHRLSVQCTTNIIIPHSLNSGSFFIFTLVVLIVDVGMNEQLRTW